LSGCNILDVGCGGGLLSESLARLGAKVTAIDPCEENIAVASLHAQKSKQQNLNYEVKTVEQLAQTSPKPLFDAITASEVIEHVESPEFFIQMCSDLLKVILLLRLSLKEINLKILFEFSLGVPYSSPLLIELQHLGL